MWRYDRFARSTQTLSRTLEEFKVLGIDFISFQEQIDSTTTRADMIFTILASLAHFESALVSERVRAGMARAKAEGKHVGRPPIEDEVQGRICGLSEQNVSISQIATRLGIAYGIAWNYVKKLETK